MKKLTRRFRILSLVARGVLIITILVAVRYAVILLVFWINPIGGREHNRRPNDELSRSVKEAVGDDFYYQGKHEDVFGGIWYEYLAKKKDKAAIANLVNALNDAVENEQRKIGVQVGGEFPCGIENVIMLENYSDDGLETPDYDGMYAISIWEPDHIRDECFDDPSIYTEIEGIRKLRIDSEMQEKAEKEGIDWYEIWPELEEILVEYDDGIRDDELVCLLEKAAGYNFRYNGKVENRDSGLICYKYLTMDEDKDIFANFVKTLNDALGDEQRKIQVQVRIEGSDLEFSVENFSDGELEKADFDGMYAMRIMDPESIPGYAEEACIPSIYTGIQGIRKLYIGPKMKKQAEKEGIDWYEIWPDLEEVEVAGWYED